jgi:hypothetical protein
MRRWAGAPGWFSEMRTDQEIGWGGDLPLDGLADAEDWNPTFLATSEVCPRSGAGIAAAAATNG